MKDENPGRTGPKARQLCRGFSRLVASLLLGLALALWLAGCQPAGGELPTLVPKAAGVLGAISGLPPTWTPEPVETPPTPTRPAEAIGQRAPTNTPLPIPTNTPVTPSPTPTATPFPLPTARIGPDGQPIYDFRPEEARPLEEYPRPPDDNGWGVHWIPTNKQEPAVVDRFVDQLIRMHIKWAVFLNDGANIGDNDYLVDRLVDAGIMPVMRVFRSNTEPYDQNLGPMVAHYRARGVYYFQLYNEPNVNEENTQSFANPNQYALAWAPAAREVIQNGGLPGIGALSPGGSFNHYTFLERTLQALRRNGDLGLLNQAWLSVHNYHGTRRLDDPDGFLLFRRYDEIVRAQLGYSLPMIGTEGGSYSSNPQVEKELLTYQYTYMREAEPYFFAFSAWLLANHAGGAHDTRWEWQSWFRDGFVHPIVTEFFYRNRE